MMSGDGADGSGSGWCPLANIIIINNAGFFMSTARNVPVPVAAQSKV